MVSLSLGSVLALCELIAFIDALSQKRQFVGKLDKQVEPANTLSVGYMPAVGCAGKCSESDCCQATYIKSTLECRIGSTSCCNIQEIPMHGHNVLQLSTANGNPIAEYLSVTNGLAKGQWKEEEYCHAGHYAIGYNIKGEKLHADYTGTNSIEIICGSRAGVECGDRAKSGASRWSDFESVITCPEKMFLVSFNMQVDPFVVSGYDNSGTNWIKFRCRHLDQQSGETEIEAYKDGKTFLKGAYGDWSNSCPVGTAICGIQTRILDYLGIFGDDIAVTDVMFRCCY